MKIVQLVSTLWLGDAVGNDVRALKKIIKEAGYETEIYAEHIDDRLPEDVGKTLDQMPTLKDEDVILYHLSIGSELNLALGKMRGRKIIRYHNITPPAFFEKYSSRYYMACLEGRNQVAAMKDIPELCITDSDFNANDLKEYNYSCKMETIPILIPFEDYDRPADEETMKQYGDGWTNFLFVGRVAPNKKHEDIIRAFAYYKKHINDKARLILAGSYAGMDAYYGRLQRYVEKLQVEDVIFTGHIKFNQILAYYRVADVFLCMSEHEGFCVPLVEAMHFSVPIIAYDKCAVKETLGSAGIILGEKDPVLIAHLMNRMATDKALRAVIVENQKKELERFAYEKVSVQFMDVFKRFKEAQHQVQG